MTEVVAFALETLREKSPVGSGDDPHPGLYRDSHMVFINGHNVKDVSGWRPGDQIDISNPVPYSRKIELGETTVRLPHYVYEETANLLAGKFGNSVRVVYLFMPLRFGSVQSYAQSLAGKASGSRRGGSKKAIRDWLVRQPTIQLTAR